MEISLIINLICMIIIFMTAFSVAGKKESAEKKLLLATMASSLLYCVSECMEILLPYIDVPYLIRLNKLLSVISIGMISVLMFRYMVVVTKPNVSKRLIKMYTGLYWVMGLLAVTSQYHFYFYKVIEEATYGGVKRFHYEYSGGYYIYSLLMVFTAILIIVMVRNYYKTVKDEVGAERKKRANILLVASYIPMIVTILFFTDAISIYDPACIGMGVSGVFLLHALNRYSYMDVVESARETVVETINVGIIILDKKYRFLEMNQFVKDIFEDIWEIILEEKEVIIEKELREILEGKRNKFEWKGKTYNCYHNKIIKNGSLSGYAVTVYDITELEQHALEMEHLKEEAEEANDQKTKFLTNVTHEIRTPMNTILGMSELALRKNKSKELEGTLKAIYHEGEGVLELINTLLDISRIESGKMQLTREKYNMDEVIYQLSNMVYMRIDEQKISYSVEVDGDFPRAFYGDRMRIKEIFQNMLGNAIKYTEAGHVLLKLGGKKLEDNHYKVLLTIEDSGVGMTENDCQNIFERFVRSSNAKVDEVIGTGLGLNITMQLVEMMNGSIRVQSEVGVGTTFFVTYEQEIAESDPLWLEPISKEKIINRLESNSFMEQIHVVFPGTHVLLVDDMESNLKVEQGLFQLYGIEPDMAGSGQEALELLKNNTYDIIFLDHMMPNMDGVETLNNIRKMEPGKETPIVAITANAVAYTTDFYEKNGFNDSLIKPLHTAELLEILKKYISKKMRSKEKMDSNKELPITNLLPEIDCVVGYKNVGGNFKQYHEILKVYYKEMAQILENLQEMANKNLERFQIEVHGIKGSSRNVGALQLSEAALRMEEWAKAGKQDEIFNYMDEFLNKMDEVMIRISTYLKETEEGIERDGDFLPELELSRVYEILKALSMFDMDEVEKALRELYKNRYTDDTEKILEELKRYVEELDYKRATTLLEEYLKKLG